MTDLLGADLLADARAIIERRKAACAPSLDAAAIEAAVTRPIIMAKFVGNLLHGIVTTLSGSQQSANDVGQYYQNAMNQLINAAGSPAAQAFGKEEEASMKPLFDQQDKALASKEAAMGISNSGAAKADYSDLQGNQSRALAGAIAPLYQSAIGSYGNIAGAGAGAQSGAYQHAIDSFYQGLQSAAAGSAGGANANPYAAGA